jgi:hypothetical protein
MTLPIDQLHDILPGPISSNAGNITLITIMFFSLATIITLCFYKLWPRYRLYLHAERKLKLILKSNDDNLIPSINEFLKNTAGLYWPHEEFASLHTKEWLAFLDNNSTCHFLKFSEEWAQWSYSNEIIESNIKKEIQYECKRWLKSICNRSPL